MNPKSCRFTRAAVAIQHKLKPFRSDSSIPQFPTESWIECERLCRLLGKAQQHRLFLAETRVRSRLRQATDRLNQTVDGVRASVDSALRHSSLPSVHDILADLRALSGEFDEVKVSMKQQVVTVLTDPIELEGIDFGQFEIVLDWQYIGDTGAYDVIAVQSNSAASNEDTTHPHVQNNSLCEGEGQVPIRNALAEGRLFDFFVLVRQILETYNPASAYVNLEDWFGAECPDCGRTMHDDESSLCEPCSTTTCCDCTSGCGSCDDRFCSECIRTCPDCDNSTCPSCLTKCAACEDEFCKGCINDERCSDCLARKEEEDEAERISEGANTDPTAATSDDTVQSVCVGEVTVPA